MIPKFPGVAAIGFAVIIILLSSALFASAQTSESDLLPSGKKSDGCTLIPDGHLKSCCVSHDRDYYWGGTFRERRESDRRLYFCIAKKEGVQHKIVAPFIWLGVRVGGLPFLPTKFRWGFGTKTRGYSEKTLKPSETDL
jgi:hypothetical protein